MTNQPVRGVLFDVDGTLVDSGYQHAVAWWEAFRKQGRDVPIATIHRAIGMGGDKLIPHVAKAAGIEGIDADAAQSAHDAIFSTWWSRLRLMPGARDLIRRCHDAGARTVLASSAGAEELAVVRELLAADALLDVVTGSADASESKPAPDLVRIGLERASLGPAEAVFLGDAVWDVQAAAAAGVRCLGVECGGTSEAELRDAGAVEVHRDPADLLARWDSSVLATIAR